MANLTGQSKNFIIRCQQSSLPEINEMFETNSTSDRILALKMPERQKKKLKSAGFPEILTVRLVKFVLSSGEIEVLATSVIDRNVTLEDFKYIYSLRWGVETFFGKIKGRLALENFTGKTVESVKQDFWSTIFISNFETVMTEEIDNKLSEKEGIKNSLKVNKAVSFNLIKKMAIDIFMNEMNQTKLIEKLNHLFLMNPISIRPNRIVERKKISHTKSLNFHKRTRKHVF